ncbi:MAG TPA: type VI secretion system tube protein Hcp [Acidimicrobiales bacterium]|nr:type VI secretion system tube protein Hcp [Acidimicrobiales bacterium]
MAESWFLKIDGIEGDSNHEGHKGEIDIEAWNWGVTQSGTAHGGGGGAGRATFQDMSFVARISKASPKLFMSCATGLHHKSAQLTGAAAGEKMRPFLTYKLSDVLVSSVQESGSEAGPPQEHFSLNYAKIEMSFTPQDATGAAGAPIVAGFDVKHNKKL